MSRTTPRVLLVGIATLDVINEVERFPPEDAEVRALAQHRRRGGNAANTATVLAQLGPHCEFLGCLADDDGGARLRAEFDAAGIDHAHCPRFSGGRTPTSYVTLSRANGSRTIVHFRDLPELGVEHLPHTTVDEFTWVHFEGRNVAVTEHMMRICAGVIPISLEVEKPRPGIASLFPLADVLLFSRQFALAAGFDEAGAFLDTMRAALPGKRLVCAWGDAGAAGFDGDHHWVPAPRIDPAVDTLGAGDTFNAGIIAALLAGRDLRAALESAVALAARKCAQIGFDRLGPPQDPPT